jgi:hypothetical protein
LKPLKIAERGISYKKFKEETKNTIKKEKEKLLKEKTRLDEVKSKVKFDFK